MRLEVAEGLCEVDAIVGCVHGSAGWFATDPNGFCWLAKRRNDE